MALFMDIHNIEGGSLRLISPPPTRRTWLRRRRKGGLPPLDSSDDAQQMAHRLAAEEGIFAGTSTGANVIAALRVAETLPSGAQVVTLAVDSGLRYLSTAPYA